MNNLQEPIQIKIENNWLQSGYFVYVAVIEYEKKKYMYIGQTGDSYHPTARGPLYRISGHFIKSTSDQNQIIQGIKKHIIGDVNASNEALEEILCKAVINYKFWKISDYAFNAPADVRERKRKATQFIEHWLNHNIRKTGEFIIFNKEAKTEISASNKIFFTDKKNVESLISKSKEIFNFFNGVCV
jgi:hypothetical protein